ncbi:hypothetical protein AB0N97_40995 [Streptomyces collinus]|uniref:hypothetical protein n=1 Tax=Streptomyces TaxID=1883 RepID=UPI0004CA6433|nr:hypothetical protein [Streptomyces sp. NRRL S-146]
MLSFVYQRHPQDIALLRPLTPHPRSLIRAPALTALRLLAALSEHELMPFAGDPAPLIRSTGDRALRRRSQKSNSGSPVTSRPARGASQGKYSIDPKVGETVPCLGEIPSI